MALNMAFAGGVSGGLFAEALEACAPEPSTWEPDAFASDLFLQRFVQQCFRVQIGAQQPVLMTANLLRVLARPPSDLAAVHLRRAVIGELAGSPELRRHFEKLYLSLCRVRALLEHANTGRNWDPTRRQLDVLIALKEVYDRMSDGFRDARSPLARLHAFGVGVQQGEPYQSLCDLLRYDERLATLTLNVGVGADGRLRGFEIVTVKEGRQNPFFNPRWRRVLAKLELFLRGYDFSEAEVMGRLLDAVFTGLQDDVVPLVQLLGEMEFYLGALGFCDQATAAGLAVCLPDLVGEQEPRRLEGLFNPLLLTSGVVPVPCNVELDARTNIVLVTGPNSGGKTRLLQSLGLAQLLAQSGLFVPARSGAVVPTARLVMSLIEETKADQAEGRLGMELLRIRALFEQLPPGAMVLLDELCSGTNPSEGEEIFELVVAMLSRLRPQAFITTHFLTFAARLERERKIPGVGFLQVELGAERRPTYQFAPGVAQTSLAGHTAERLGVTGEQLMAVIEANIRRCARAGIAQAPPPVPGRPAPTFGRFGSVE